jgi:hypothetical protein
VTVKRISFPSAATLASASGIAAWEGMERTVTVLLNYMYSVLNYFTGAGPIIASIVPAATAVPITPATLGPIACINRKLEGLYF